MEFSIDLPLPVSTNVFYRHVPGVRTPLISKAGRAYIKQVYDAVLGHPDRLSLPIKGRLKLYAVLICPDRMRRDMDNYVGKALLDSLTKAGVYLDDSQIDEIHGVRRLRPGKSGVQVKITQIALVLEPDL